jgi:protein O-GlcNAc transferase
VSDKDNDLLESAFTALELNDYKASALAFESVLKSQPEHIDALHYLGVSLHYLQDYPRALACFKRSIALSSADADLYHNFFTCGYELYGEQKYEQAIVYFLALIELNMDYLEQSWIYLIRALKTSNRIDECLQYLGQAVLRFPENFALRMENTFLFPQIYTSTDEIDYWRKRFLKQLEELNLFLTPERTAAIQERGVDACNPLFGIFAQGFNEAETTQKISQVWEKIIPIVQREALPRLSQKTEKLRIGLISPSFWNHSTMHYFLGVIAHLSQEPDLELFAFYLGEGRFDGITERVKGYVDHFEGLSWHLEPCLEVLNRARPDILLYLDIGQEPFLYTLASNRIAPVQCALTGLPMTTGLKNLDYYLSGRVFEVPEAQSHYSEKLVLFDGPIVTYLPPPTAPIIKTREELGLSPDKNLYLFPMTLFRVDPEFSEIIPAILRQDPLAQWLFIGYRGLEDRILAHYQTLFPELCERICFLPWLDQADFLALMARVDVIMDSLRLGAGNLAFQAFEMNAPIVTLPSEFLRCRIATGLYQIMGITDCIADDLQDYIAKALLIAQDKSYHRSLSERIAAQKHLIFNNLLSSQEMADWFRTLIPQV